MEDKYFWMHLFGGLAKAVLAGAGLVGLVRYRRLPTGLRYLVLLVGFELVLEIGSKLLMMNKLPNVFLGVFDSVGELWLLSLVYDRALGSAGFTRWRPWLAGGFVLYAVVSGTLFFESARFNMGVMLLESVLVLGMAGLYFRKLLNELHVPRLGQDAMFWVSAGLLLYFLGKLLIALFSNYMLAHYSLKLNLDMWTLHALLAVVLYACYGRALWIRPRK